MKTVGLFFTALALGSFAGWCSLQYERKCKLEGVYECHVIEINLDTKIIYGEPKLYDSLTKVRSHISDSCITLENNIN